MNPTAKILFYSSLALTLLVIVASFPASQDSQADDSKPLRLLHVFFRHSVRAPTSTYPNDPYAGSTYWPDGYGQLTIKGKQRAYKVGQALQRRYGDFFGSRYSPKEVYFRSTDFDRTLMTTQLIGAAIFPPKGEQVWNPDLPWQPIPVHTVSNEKDWLAQERLCAPAKESVEKALNSPEIKAYDSQYEELYQYIQNHTDMPINNLMDVADVYGTLYSEKSNDLTLPEWTDKIYQDPMPQISGESFKIYTYDDKLKRLVAGPVLKEVVEHFKQVKDGKLSKQQKGYFYGTHDKIISAIRDALGVFEPPVLPPFASTVVFELRGAPEDMAVKILYYDDPDKEPRILAIPGCETLCPLDIFLEKTAPYIPENWHKECGYTE